MAVSCIYMTGARKHGDKVAQKISGDLPPAANLDATNDLSIRKPGDTTGAAGEQGTGDDTGEQQAVGWPRRQGRRYLLLVILVL